MHCDVLPLIRRASFLQPVNMTNPLSTCTYNPPSLRTSFSFMSNPVRPATQYICTKWTSMFACLQARRRWLIQKLRQGPPGNMARQRDKSCSKAEAPKQAAASAEEWQVPSGLLHQEQQLQPCSQQQIGLCPGLDPDILRCQACHDQGRHR